MDPFFDDDDLDGVYDLAIPDDEPDSSFYLPEEQTCAGCGCSDSHACPEGCVWATPTLCSQCVLKQGGHHV